MTEDFSELVKRANDIVEGRVRLLEKLAALAGESVDEEAKNWFSEVASVTIAGSREQATRWLRAGLRAFFDGEWLGPRIVGLRVIDPNGDYYALPFPSLTTYRAANVVGQFLTERLSNAAQVSVRAYRYKETEEIGILVEVFTADRANCLADALLVHELGDAE